MMEESDGSVCVEKKYSEKLGNHRKYGIPLLYVKDIDSPLFFASTFRTYSDVRKGALTSLH